MIYIVYNELYSPMFGNGIRRKILGQIKAFKRSFGRVFHTCYMGQMLYLFDGEKQVEKEFAITKQDCNKIIWSWIEKYKIKRTYIRYAFADKWFIHFLKNQKAKGVKSVIEIPTFPYDGEGIQGRVKIEDAHYRKDMYIYIDLVTTNSDEPKIWKIPCIPMMNGVDIHDYELCINKKQRKNQIVLIGVSTLVFWQGYERVIQGLYNYYKNRNEYKIFFKIVGEGTEKKYYQSLVQKYDLLRYVEFCGNLDGKELDRQYTLSDIAVSSLGRYKSGVESITPIKAAEYCMRGIPFICGYHDMRFAGNEKFIMNIPNNSDPVNMDRVIDFYKEIYKNTGYQKQMNNYATEYLSWDVVLKPIVEFLW